jgi:hypothetical protein
MTFFFVCKNDGNDGQWLFALMQVMFQGTGKSRTGTKQIPKRPFALR